MKKGSNEGIFLNFSAFFEVFNILYVEKRLFEDTGSLFEDI